MKRLLCLVVLGLTLLAMPLHAAEVTGLTPWQLDASYAGGSQYDARLDLPIQFWGAGLPLARVFAGISEQTGVTIGFFPPDDDNARVCVNLYLNREQPPALREFLAQLAWVTDCAFTTSETAEGRRYDLFFTSVKEGAAARLKQLGRATQQKVRQRHEELRARRTETIPDRWQQAMAAAALSREEALQRYQGKDDLMLLAAVDPGRRALIAFLQTLPPEELEQLLHGGQILKDWSSFSPEQQAVLRDLFAANLESYRTHTPDDAARAAAYPWKPDRSLTVALFGDQYSLGVGAAELGAGGSRESAAPAGLASISLIDQLESGVMTPDLLDLRRALGQPVGPEEAEAMNQAEEARQEVFMANLQAQVMQETLKERCRLSEETRRALSAVSLPMEAGHSYARWQVQEAVAAASGRNVVSDSFLDPERNAAQVRAAMCPEATGPITGAQWLCLTAAAMASADKLIGRVDPADQAFEAAGWEVKEAGSFLRFRSTERDFWRAAFLPREAMAEVDRWFAAKVEAACETPAAQYALDVAIPLPEASRLSVRLSEHQARLGGYLTYDDPLDLREACRRALRGPVLRDLDRGNWALSVVANLTPDQWQRVRAEGLPWREVRPAAQPAGNPLLRARFLKDPKEVAGLTLHVSRDDPAHPGHRGSHLLVLRRGDEQVVGGLLLIEGVKATVRPVQSLVPLGPRGGGE